MKNKRMIRRTIKKIKKIKQCMVKVTMYLVCPGSRLEPLVWTFGDTLADGTGDIWKNINKKYAKKCCLTYYHRRMTSESVEERKK